MNNIKIEITFLNVLEGKDVPVTIDSDATALSLASLIKALTDHGHIVSGVSFIKDDAAGYDDPLDILMNTTNPCEDWTIEDATRVLSEAEANGWNFAPNVTPQFILDLYNDMEPEKEDE